MRLNIQDPCTSTAKAILLGDQAVGKTTIAKVLVSKQQFSMKGYEMTHGVDLFEKILTVDEKQVHILIIDTSGHSVYEWLVDELYCPELIPILCFDTTNMNSFDRLEEIIRKFSINKGLLLACKSDLINRQSVPTNLVESFAKKHALISATSSMKMATADVEKLFAIAIKRYHD